MGLAFVHRRTGRAACGTFDGGHQPGVEELARIAVVFGL
jgi:hypothetical protein